MKLYAHDDEVIALEQAGAPDLQDLVSLAWHLRQRDGDRALRLAARAEEMRRPGDRHCGARLALIRAEVALQMGELDLAQTQITLAHAGFGVGSDGSPQLIGQGDTLLLEAQLAFARGQAARGTAAQDHAATLYAQAQDAERQMAARAGIAAILGRTAFAQQQALITASQEQATMLERLSAAMQELENLTITDAMTGLRNRRFLTQSLDSDALLALRRYDVPEPSTPLSTPPDADLIFLLIDLDHFRLVNDEHGHAAGDAVLVQLAERLRPLFREADHLVRWGGEEFLIVARGSGRERAAELAERVRQAVANRPFQLPDDSPLSQTCSIGFTCFPFAPQAPRAVGWQDVVAMADLALDAAKRGGRNAWVGLGHGNTQFRPLILQRAKSHLRHLIDNTELIAQTSLPIQTLKAALI